MIIMLYDKHCLTFSFKHDVSVIKCHRQRGSYSGGPLRKTLALGDPERQTMSDVQNNNHVYDRLTFMTIAEIE
jgi:hypothetical protein